MSQAVGLEKPKTQQDLSRELDPDIGYQRKETTGETAVYEPAFTADSDLEEYLEDIEIEGYCDVEKIALDFEQGKALMDTKNVDEEFDKVYKQLVNSESDYLGHTYGKDTAELERRDGDVIVDDGTNEYSDPIISSRIELFETVSSQYTRAMDVAEGREYSSVVAPSLEQELSDYGQINRSTIEDKLEDTLEVLELEAYEVDGRVYNPENFGDLVDAMNEGPGKNMWKRLSDTRLCQADLGENWRMMALSGSEFEPLHDKTVYAVGVSRKGDNGEIGQEGRIDEWASLSDSELVEATKTGL